MNHITVQNGKYLFKDKKGNRKAKKTERSHQGDATFLIPVGIKSRL